jgi:RHS repeat-associated protein
VCLLGLGCWAPPLAGAAGGSTDAGVGQGEPVATSFSLRSPFQAATVLAPQRVAADQVSRTAFEGLSGKAAVSLAKRDFHIEQPVWTAPGAEEGGHLESYIGESAAVEKLPDGQRVVVSSTVPLRTDDDAGQPAPVSLALRSDGEGGYVPENPLVPVVISKRAGGIAFPLGIGAAPVSAASTEAPAVIGNAVAFANVSQDTDLIEEPLPYGAGVSWQLRSQRSAEEQGLRFSLPAGASLQASKAIPGGAEVSEDGRTVLLIPPASAQDADGHALATSYSISGDVLRTHVDLSGSVDFPVLLDPILLFEGFYGTRNGSGSWAGWGHSLGAGFELTEEPGLLEVEANSGEPFESRGDLYIFPPGPHGKPGSAGITRVDISGMGHGSGEESEAYAEIGESNGSTPIYTFNGGNKADDLPEPYATYESLSNRNVAFCAQSGGGEDGGSQPLCNETENQGAYFTMEDVTAVSDTKYDDYVALTAATVTFRDPAVPNKDVLNHSGYTEGEWRKTPPTGFTITAESEGLGIAEFKLEIPAENPKGAYFTQKLSCSAQNGFAGCPSSATSESINLSGGSVEETGVYSLAPVAVDAAKNTTRPKESYVSLYIDRTAPVIGALTGTLGEAAGKVIGDGNYILDFDPVDGSTASPQSGVHTVEVKVDGQLAYTDTTKCPSPKGVPAEYCFGLSGSWTMKAAKYGAGTHTVTVVAKDWLGNESSKSFTVTVNEAGYQPVGPGAVNLETGNFQAGATDVSIPSGATTLSVLRTFNSQATAEEEAGPLGPHWTLSVPGSASQAEWHSLTQLQGGSTVTATKPDGQTVTFTQSEGGYTSPAGYQSETLSKVSASEYKIADAAGDSTVFKEETGTTTFYPAEVVQDGGAGGLDPIKYVFAKSTEGFTEPKEVLGPEPSSEACKTTLVKGCRALTFKYATSTTAKGESSSEWGNYDNRLEEVKFTAWEPVKGEMKTYGVAYYAYDKLGRLRSEWDPRLASPLKTDLGYNSENLLTAMTPPGQQTWAVTYGTIGSDTSAGRAVKVMRSQAAAPLWNGKAPEKTGFPQISGKPSDGTTIGVSSGSWSNEPITYGYQWEECNTKGEECKLIGGATNPNYTPPPGNFGYTLVAIVTATNGGGSVSVASEPSSVVTDSGGVEGTRYPPEPGSTIEYRVPVSGTGAPYAMGAKEVEAWFQYDKPAQATAIFPPSEPQAWPATTYTATQATVFYLDGADRTVNTATPGGGISTAEFNTTNNDLERTLSPDNREAALKEGSHSAEAAAKLSTTRSYGEGGTELTDVMGPEHTIKLANGTEAKARKNTQYFYDEGAPEEGRPYRLVTKTVEGAQLTGVEEEKRTVVDSYSGQSNLGWKLHEPTSSTTTAGGVTLKSTTTYEPLTGEVEETSTPAAVGKDARVPPRYGSAFGTKGTGAGQFGSLSGDAIDASGDAWAVDPANNRIEKFSASGAFDETIGFGVSNGEAKLESCTSSCLAGIAGANPGQFSDPVGIAISGGYVYIADYGNDRIEKLKENGEYVTEFGSKGIRAGQLEGPVSVGVTAAGDVWIGEKTNDRLSEFNASSGAFLETIGFGVISPGEDKFEKCTGKGETCEAGITGSGPGQFDVVRGITTVGARTYVADSGDDRIDSFNDETGEYLSTFGSKGAGNGQFNEPTGITENPSNGYLYIADSGNDRIEAMSTGGEYIFQFGYKGTGSGQFSTPEGIAINANDAYVADTGDYRIEEWVPSITGNEGAHTTQTIYYTAGANTHVEDCGEHPEWAGLPCQAQPAAQPEATGAPNLPVTTYPSYNVWQEPLTTVDTVTTGTKKATRTATLTYDGPGRPLTSTLTASEDKTVPKVTNEYSKTLGALIAQSTTEGKTTKSISTELNTLGQTTTYTDAEGVTTKYEYEKEKDDRLVRVIDGEGTPAASTDTYSYNPTTGLIASLTDSGAGTFTATRDVEGNLTSEGYPNGMNAKYTLNPVGEPVSLEYVKTTHCTTGCTWYTDSVSPSIHGQWLSQTSSLSKETDTFNEAGRLTEAQETPAGKDCTARLYGFDEDGNRTSLTTRESTTEKCPTEGGSAQSYAYDSADHLVEAGVSYESFGNTINLPAADAGGYPLVNTYYVNNTLASQEQNGEKISYNLDPAGRVRETVSTGTTNLTVTSHYAGPGDTPAWTITSAGAWTRNISGITGALAATETNSKKPTLELSNLHGDIIATALDNETESKFTPATETNEYGVPRTPATEKYGWLGADGVATELPTGIINMGARAYVPQLGRFEQSDPQPGGASNAYAYTDGDPVSEADPSGEYTSTTIYNDEAAEAGAAEEGLSQEYAGPGAIVPPPVNLRIEEEFNAHPPWDAAHVARAARVLWEKPGCSGTRACAAGGFLGFKVELGEIYQWWKQVKKGYELVKEAIEGPLVQTLKENKTVCKAVGYATSAGLYYLPDSVFTKNLGFALGIGTTFAC